MKAKSNDNCKIFIFVISAIFLFSIFQIWAVFSSSNIFKLESISVLSKSDTLDEGFIDISGNVISNNSVKFHKVGDSITYSLKLKNSKNKRYTLKSINNDNKNEYISFSYDKHKNKKLSAGETFDFIFTGTYSNEVDDILQREQKFPVNFYLVLEDEKGNIFAEKLNLSENPLIGDNFEFYTILSLIPLTFAIIIFKKLFMKKTSIKNKNSNLKFFILFVTVCLALLPRVSQSLENRVFAINLNNNIELKDKLVVSYDIDGVIDTKIIPYGTKLPIEAPEKDEYVFKGWQTEDGSIFDEESDIKDDINLKAIFEANVYHITYNLNGGEANNPGSYTIEDELLINDPSRVGYTFEGWTGTDLTALTKNLVINKGSSGDRIYDAHWTPNKYTIVFDSNGGTGNMDSRIMTYGVSDNLPPNKFKNGNSTFLSWNTQKDGSGSKYLDAAPVKNLPDKEPVTLYAQWSNNWAMFVQGTKLNPKMKELAGNTNANANTVDNNVVSIIRSYNLPPQSATVVSTSESPNNIYIWYENNVIYYYSEAKYIYLNPSSQQAFSYFNALKSIDVDNFLTDKVTNMYGMFGQCRSLQSLDLRSFNTFQVKDMSSMFNQCNSLSYLNVSSFNTNSVTNMNRMFTACTSLQELHVSSFNTGNVENMEKMFDNLPLMQSIDVSGFNTSKVTKMNGMFRDCPGLKTLNLRNFNTNMVNTMEEMFDGCSLLTSISINPSKFKTSNVKSMKQMFYQCNNLKSFDFSGFDTGNVTDMSSMFGHCKSLNTLNLSTFNTSKVTNMSNMFNQCNSLTSINISNFNTSLVSNMNRMFSSCYLLKKLDVSSFNTRIVTDMEKMFDNMLALTTIYASDSFTTANVTKGGNMFINDTNLVGGNKTAYDPSNVGYTYACIDSASTPGYFTGKY